MPERLYDLVEERRVKSSRKDPVEEVLEEEKRQMAEEARMLRLQEIIEERRRRIEKLKKGLDKGEIQPAQTSLASILTTLGGDPQKIDELLKNLSPESMQKLILLTSATSGNPNVLLPLALMTRTEGSPNQIAQMANTYLDHALDMIKKTGQPMTADGLANLITAISSALKPQGGGQNQLVEKLIEELRETRKALQEEKIKHLEEKIRESRIDPVQYLKHVAEVAEKLGFKKEGETSEKDLLLEKMREEHELKLMEIDLNLQKWMYERQLEQQKNQTMMNLVSAMLPMATGGIQKTVKALAKGGFGEGEKRRGVEASCPECGAKIFVPGPPFPQEIVCKKCGAVLEPEKPTSTQKQQSKSQKQPKTKPVRFI